MLEQPRERRIRASSELFELVLADAVDQEAENGEVLPGGDQAAKGLQVALLVRPTEDVRGIHADVTCQAGELAEVVDLLCSRTCDHQLVDLRGRRGQHRVDVQVGTADLAVRLDR